MSLRHQYGDNRGGRELGFGIGLASHPDAIAVYATTMLHDAHAEQITRDLEPRSAWPLAADSVGCGFCEWLT